MRTVSIMAIGSEITQGLTLDTNSKFMSYELLKNGYSVRRHICLPDKIDEIVESLNYCLSLTNAVIITGGLGPTADDLTREAIAVASGNKLTFYPELEKQIKNFYPQNHHHLIDKMAYLPKDSITIPPQNGAAGGFMIMIDSKPVFCLPGVPKEMKPMISGYVIAELDKLLRAETYSQIKVFKTSGAKELTIEEKIKQIEGDFSYGILPSKNEVKIYLNVEANSEKAASEKLVDISNQAKELLGDLIYAEDDQTLESVIGNLLLNKKLTLTVAESITAGSISDRVTSVPGSSAYFTGGFVTYSNHLKEKLIGVDPIIIKKHGAVSEQVAIEMARGALVAADADISLSVTGIAGPTGQTAAKPLGLTYIGYADKDTVEAHKFVFSGARDDIKLQAAQKALEILRRRLVGI